jgi:hypothetical protein
MREYHLHAIRILPWSEREQLYCQKLAAWQGFSFDTCGTDPEPVRIFYDLKAAKAQAQGTCSSATQFNSFDHRRRARRAVRPGSSCFCKLSIGGYNV